jgi:hypothetical protein
VQTRHARRGRKGRVRRTDCERGRARRDRKRRRRRLTGRRILGCRRSDRDSGRSRLRDGPLRRAAAWNGRPRWRGVGRHRRARRRRRRRRSRGGRSRRPSLRVGRRWTDMRWRDVERRQQQLRIQVALRVARQPDAEVDVRHRLLRDAACSGEGDRCTFVDLRAFVHEHRAEVEQRRGVAVGCLDRDRPPAGRDRADERDAPADGSEHRRTERALEVDAAMLSGLERELGVEDVRAQHRPRERPCPRLSGAGEHERDRGESAGEDEVTLPGMQTAVTVPGRSVVVKSAYSDER